MRDRLLSGQGGLLVLAGLVANADDQSPRTRDATFVAMRLEDGDRAVCPFEWRFSRPTRELFDQDQGDLGPRLQASVTHAGRCLDGLSGPRLGQLGLAETEEQ